MTTAAVGRRQHGSLTPIDEEGERYEQVAEETEDEREPVDDGRRHEGRVLGPQLSHGAEIV